MSWEISIPYRDRGDRLDLADIADLTRAAIPDRTEREIARNVLLELATEPGIESFGDALDAIERADPARRRLLLDRARGAAGLEPTGIVDRDRELRRAQRDDPVPPSARQAGPRDSGWQLCAEPSCNAVPVGESGQPVETRVRRWWCPAHRHLAVPGDLEPFEPAGWTLTSAGIPRPVLSAADREFYRELDRKQREEDAERNRRRVEEGERLAKLEEEYRGRMRPPAGFR